MIEYLDTDEQREVHDFILDVIESYIDIQIEIKTELLEDESYE